MREAMGGWRDNLPLNILFKWLPHCYVWPSRAFVGIYVGSLCLPELPLGQAWHQPVCFYKARVLGDGLAVMVLNLSIHLLPNGTELYCTILYCTVLNCRQSFAVYQLKFVSFSPSVAMYCTVLYCTVLYCTELHYSVLHFTKCNVLMYCTELYCNLL